MLGVKINFIFFLIIAFSLNSCNNNKDKNKGVFTFYTSEKNININDYKLYESTLENIYLVIKDSKKRKLVINSKIDSMDYKVGNKTYRACRINTTKDKYCDFNFEVTNDYQKLFVSGKDNNECEMLFIGFKNKLDFIVSNNSINIDLMNK